mmetsp:Transcript_5649/g.8794  ORF Transcript_5649/g.8794 Transcript_5649/m.8794 type:complete len:216 (-) Transcript_5649:94-741(-)
MAELSGGAQHTSSNTPTLLRKPSPSNPNHPSQSPSNPSDVDTNRDSDESPVYAYAQFLTNDEEQDTYIASLLDRLCHIFLAHKSPLLRLFHEIDQDDDGIINREEFQQAIVSASLLGLPGAFEPFSEEDAAALFSAISADNSIGVDTDTDTDNEDGGEHASGLPEGIKYMEFLSSFSVVNSNVGDSSDDGEEEEVPRHSSGMQALQEDFKFAASN